MDSPRLNLKPLYEENELIKEILKGVKNGLHIAARPRNLGEQYKEELSPKVLPLSVVNQTFKRVA